MHAPAPASAILSTSPATLWAGRALSALVVLMLIASAATKLSGAPEIVAKFTGKYLYPAAAIGPIALVELCCAALYAIPRTRILGAILVTGYLGGAVATHVRASDAFVVPLACGVIAWAGLYLRDRTLRALVSPRSPAA